MVGGAGQWALAHLVILVEKGYSRSIHHHQKHKKQYYVYTCCVQYLLTYLAVIDDVCPVFHRVLFPPSLAIVLRVLSCVPPLSSSLPYAS